MGFGVKNERPSQTSIPNQEAVVVPPPKQGIAALKQIGNSIAAKEARVPTSGTMPDGQWVETKRTLDVNSIQVSPVDFRANSLAQVGEVYQFPRSIQVGPMMFRVALDPAYDDVKPPKMPHSFSENETQFPNASVRLGPDGKGLSLTKDQVGELIDLLKQNKSLLGSNKDFKQVVDTLELARQNISNASAGPVTALPSKPVSAEASMRPEVAAAMVALGKEFKIPGDANAVRESLAKQGLGLHEGLADNPFDPYGPVDFSKSNFSDDQKGWIEKLGLQKIDNKADLYAALAIIDKKNPKHGSNYLEKTLRGAQYELEKPRKGTLQTPGPYFKSPTMKYDESSL